MSQPGGYAVLDTETTGILPGFRHRIAEIAVIHLDHDGPVTGEWCTLVNPERDVGPQSIHGIRAAEVRRAPTFGQIAGDLVERLHRRVPVAHNWAFDAMHLRAEFARLEIETPFEISAGLCTMTIAATALPGSARSLLECCEWVGLALKEWHTALADARAAGTLLQYYLAHTPQLVRLTGNHVQAARWQWPQLPHEPIAPVLRATNKIQLHRYLTAPRADLACPVTVQFRLRSAAPCWNCCLVG